MTLTDTWPSVLSTEPPGADDLTFTNFGDNQVSNAAMAIQWLTHSDKKVFLLDFRGRSRERVEQLAREVQLVITAQPPASLLVLADFTGVIFTNDIVKQIARVAAVDRRHVLRTAWVGTGGLPAEQFKWVKEVSGREIRHFATREEALEFLTEP